MLEWKIQKLKADNQMSEGYKDLIHGNDPNDACMPYQIYKYVNNVLFFVLCTFMQWSKCMMEQ